MTPEGANQLQNEDQDEDPEDGDTQSEGENEGTLIIDKTNDRNELKIIATF